MIDIISGKDTDTGAIANTKKGSKAGLVVALLCLAALAAGGGYWVKTHNKPVAAVVSADDPVTAVKTADAAWAKAAAAHDLVNSLAFYAGDAVVLPAHQEMLTNKPDILKSWTALLDKNNTVTWKPMWVEAAKSGELVYVVGTYTLSTKAGKGKPTVDHGKYMAVWKKQDDGSWKAEANSWNSDLPLAGAKRS
jgi:ketosteroid isomerase-like protein